MWLPEIYNRMEDTQIAICQQPKKIADVNNYYKVVTSGNNSSNGTIKPKMNQYTFNSSSYNKTAVGGGGGGSCQRELYSNNVVYLKTFLIALSNVPGALISIFCIDKIGRRNLLGKILNFPGTF